MEGTLLAQLVSKACSRGRDRPAIQTEGARVTYGELESLSLQLSRRLLALGVTRGDRVLCIFPSSAEYVVALLATTAVGAIAVPLPTSISGDRLAYVVELVEPRLCMTRGSSSPHERVPHEQVVIEAERMRVASPAEASAPRPTATSEDDAIILFSSGSTGRPKGVVLKHRHLLATAENLSTLFGLAEDHRDLILAPMFHSDGWQRVAATLFAGGCVVTTPHSLSPRALLAALPDLDIRGLFLPPPMLRLVLRSAPDVLEKALAPLRSLEIGSAPVSADEFRRLAALMPKARIFFHYGLTECSRAVVLDVRAHPDKLDTVGREGPGVEIRICAPDGRPVSPGVEGQICLRGRQQTNGYFHLEELNRQKFVDGWLLTGDYGRLDADGFLTLLGRHDDMITSAGFHFFPAEVEMDLGTMPGVVEYVIAGVRDPSGILEQTPWAFVVPVDASAWSPAEFITLARTRLPPHMVPRHVVAVPSLPLTASGKPDRRKTTELYAKPARTE